MPTKKSTKKSESQKSDDVSFDFQKFVNNSESYKSLIYGIITVVVLFVVIALGIRTLQQNRAEIDDLALSTQNIENNTSKYIVREGDTLWSIAEKTYGDGFKWNEIAKANNITSAAALEKGMTLDIPEIIKTNEESKMDAKITALPTLAATPTSLPSPTIIVKQNINTVPDQVVNSKLSGNSYTVVKGDTLWDISVRAYGNGYRWVEIAKLNNLKNPNLIHPGNVFNLPRP